jgi:hypothetical protein
MTTQAFDRVREMDGRSLPQRCCQRVRGMKHLRSCLLRVFLHLDYYLHAIGRLVSNRTPEVQCRFIAIRRELLLYRRSVKTKDRSIRMRSPRPPAGPAK